MSKPCDETVPERDEADRPPDAGAARHPEHEAVLPIVYDELRRLAERYLDRERAGHTLQPTALVHEAFLRVREQTGITWKDPAQFSALAARAMRRVLVDHARRKLAGKRGNYRGTVSLDDAPASPMDGESSAADVLALHEALAALAARHARQASVVEMRFFGGLSVAEVARVVGVSERQVAGDWRVARAWLNRELARGVGDD